MVIRLQAWQQNRVNPLIYPSLPAPTWGNVLRVAAKHEYRAAQKADKRGWMREDPADRTAYSHDFCSAIRFFWMTRERTIRLPVGVELYHERWFAGGCFGGWKRLEWL